MSRARYWWPSDANTCPDTTVARPVRPALRGVLSVLDAEIARHEGRGDHDGATAARALRDFRERLERGPPPED